MSLGLDLGPGGVITAYDPKTAPAPCCSTRRCARPTTSTPHWAGGLTLRQWLLPGSNRATMFAPDRALGARELRFGRVFIEAAMGPTSTKYAWTFGFDVGGGIEWDIPDAPGFGIGPYLRYGPVIDPIAAPATTGTPGRWADRSPITSAARRRAPAETGPRRGGGAYRISCPIRITTASATTRTCAGTCRRANTPIRSAPAARRTTRTATTSLTSTIPARSPRPDRTPDPKRPGCPLVDTDKDGIPDPEDACPSKAGPATPIPRTSAARGEEAGGRARGGRAAGRRPGPSRPRSRSPLG